jgi:hypothetical protein
MTMEARPENSKTADGRSMSGETFASAPKTRAPTQQLCGYSLAMPHTFLASAELHHEALCAAAVRVFGLITGSTHSRP